MNRKSRYVPPRFGLVHMDQVWINIHFLAIFDEGCGCFPNDRCSQKGQAWPEIWGPERPGARAGVRSRCCLCFAPGNLKDPRKFQDLTWGCAFESCIFMHICRHIHNEDKMI